MGQGEVVDYTWGQTMNQARRMAAHLRGLALEPGARIAILAKNSAHFLMTELAIWMAGGTTNQFVASLLPNAGCRRTEPASGVNGRKVDRRQRLEMAGTVSSPTGGQRPLSLPMRRSELCAGSVRWNVAAVAWRGDHRDGSTSNWT